MQRRRYLLIRVKIGRSFPFARGRQPRGRLAQSRAFSALSGVAVILDHRRMIGSRMRCVGSRFGVVVVCALGLASGSARADKISDAMAECRGKIKGDACSLAGHAGACVSRSMERRNGMKKTWVECSPGKAATRKHNAREIKEAGRAGVLPSAKALDEETVEPVGVGVASDAAIIDETKPAVEEPDAATPDVATPSSEEAGPPSAAQPGDAKPEVEAENNAENNAEKNAEKNAENNAESRSGCRTGAGAGSEGLAMFVPMLLVMLGRRRRGMS